MKKLKLNSTLNHKSDGYETYDISIEKVITLYGKSFSELRDHPLRDNPYIAENRDLMYMDSDNVAHCLLFVDYDSGDGILVESEGADYARKSQFIPMFIENYLPFLDEPYQGLFRLQMIAINKLNERIRQDQPLVEFAKQVSNTDNLIDMNDMAKLARADDIQIGRNRLYDWLRGMGVLMSNNIPYQKYIEKGYFSVKETVFETGTMTKTYQQTFVTSKGQRYITGLLKKYYA